MLFQPILAASQMGSNNQLLSPRSPNNLLLAATNRRNITFGYQWKYQPLIIIPDDPSTLDYQATHRPHVLLCLLPTGAILHSYIL